MGFTTSQTSLLSELKSQTGLEAPDRITGFLATGVHTICTYGNFGIRGK